MNITKKLLCTLLLSATSVASQASIIHSDHSTLTQQYADFVENDIMVGRNLEFYSIWHGTTGAAVQDFLSALSNGAPSLNVETFLIASITDTSVAAEHAETQIIGMFAETHWNHPGSLYNPNGFLVNFTDSTVYRNTGGLGNYGLNGGGFPSFGYQGMDLTLESNHDGLLNAGTALHSRTYEGPKTIFQNFNVNSLEAFRFSAPEGFNANPATSVPEPTPILAFIIGTLGLAFRKVYKSK